MDASPEESSTYHGQDSAAIRARAEQALQRGDFEWAEKQLARGEIDLAKLTENLRIYQAELEIQNTELREAQTAAQRLALRYNTLFSTVPLAELVIDCNGLILDANQAATRLFGLHNRHLRHHFIHRLVAKRSELHLGDALALARDQGIGRVSEMHFLTATGERFAGELHLSRLPKVEDEGCQLVCAVVDMSERLRQESDIRLAHARLQESESRFRHLSGLVSDIAYSCVEAEPNEFVLDWVSGAVEAITGHTAEAIMAMGGWRDLILESDRPLFDHQILGLKAGQGSTCQFRLCRRDGTIAWIEADTKCVRGEDGVQQLYGGLVDITVRKEAEDKLRQTARAFESAAEGVIITDFEANILSVNRAFTEITGYSEADAIGQNPRMLQSGRHDPTFYQTMWANLLATGRWQGEIWNRRRNGELYPQWLTIANVTDDVGRVTHFVAVFGDISELKRSQEQIAFLAHHDALTQLPNRALLNDRLEHSITRARRRREGMAVLFIDLDRFKMINDSLGHAVGDELLRSAALRMSEQLRASDTLARVGGDEFVLILEDADCARRAGAVARKLLEVFAQPYRLKEHELFVTASIGISLYPRDGESPDVLLRHADLAMYKAKSLGRNLFQFYQTDMATTAVERLELGNALRGALTRQEFVIYYQPQICLATGKVVGVEALVRWQHPRLGLIMPGHFIPVAEEIGIIGDIGAWVLRAAARQLMDWQTAGMLVPRVAVNLAIQQLERGSLLALVAEVLAETGLEASQLELEVTESMIMHQADRAIATLQGLRQLGVEIAVDDFGTGYSSLGYIRRIPLNRLKIDYSFVRDIGRDPDDEVIVRAIIGLGRSLGLDVIAEGVEREDQAAFLCREGCRVGQGYLFSHPTPAKELESEWVNVNFTA